MDNASGNSPIATQSVLVGLVGLGLCFGGVGAVRSGAAAEVPQGVLREHQDPAWLSDSRPEASMPALKLDHL